MGTRIDNSNASAGRDVKIVNRTSSKLSIAIGTVVVICVVAIIAFFVLGNRNSVVGVWQYPNRSNTISFSKNGTVSDSFSGKWGPGTYETDGNKLIINSTFLGPSVYQFEIKGNQLILKEEDGGTYELVFTKVS